MRALQAAGLGLLLMLGGCQTQAPLVCGDPASTIGQIQGSKPRSELVGQQVIVEGVVTAVQRDEENRISGVFLQSAAPDNDPQTSDALFAVGVEADSGDRVRVAGTVTELDKTLTAVESRRFEACGDAVVPAPSPVFLPLRGRHIESLEGMLITVTSDMRFSGVTWFGGSGQAVVAAGGRLLSPTEVAEPGRIASEMRVNNLRRSIALDDLSDRRDLSEISWWPNGRSRLPAMGQKVGNLTGVLDHRGGYRLRLTETVTPEPTQPRAAPAAPARAGSLRVVGFNVLNLFNGNGRGGGFPTTRGARTEAEYLRQQRKLVAALTALDADILALQELENDGTDPGSAAADLAQALSEASGRAYQTIGWPGGQRGGDQIAVGLMYASDVVAPVGDAHTKLDGPFEYYNRPPLAQTFRHLDSGRSLAVVSLHLKSKGCGEASGKYADQRDGQGCWNPKRVEAAEAIADWLDDESELNASETLLIGDFNAYSREDPVQALTRRGFRSAVSRREPQYSYVFRGAAGSLDQALAGRALSGRIAAASYWHVNADFPAWLDYRQGNRPEGLFKSDPVRSSDHDPMVVDFRL
ncbi:MAG: ExeM/NucH family extracellular endonuclease [Pseudomonadota bacterium]